MLVFFGQREKAANLQRKFQEYFEQVRSNLNLLIPVEVPSQVEDEKKTEKDKENLKNKQAQALMTKSDWSLSLFQ